MGCNCCECPNIVAVSSIAVADGITTLTVPAGTIFTNGKCYCLGLFLTVPAGTNGTQIDVTDGTNTYTIYNRLANYWRPCCALHGRSILKVKFLDDPVHFLKI